METLKARGEMVTHFKFNGAYKISLREGKGCDVRRLLCLTMQFDSARNYTFTNGLLDGESKNYRLDDRQVLDRSR